MFITTMTTTVIVVFVVVLNCLAVTARKLKHKTIAKFFQNCHKYLLFFVEINQKRKHKTHFQKSYFNYDTNNQRKISLDL